MGHHDADWEHVTLRVSKPNLDRSRSALYPDRSDSGRMLLSVYFAAHGYADGTWRSTRLSVDQNGVEHVAPIGFELESSHPVAFVARNGHGHYPRGGTWFRIWGVANDHCGERGRSIEWRPRPHLLRLPEHRQFWSQHQHPHALDHWASAQLNFESCGIDAPATQRWARGECDSPNSTWRRIFRFS